MPPTITVSIINFRTGPLTLQCVRSVLADIGEAPVQIVVVDNDSGDGSAEEIADWIAGQPAGTPVTLVRSSTNAGFSGGHNIGMSTAPAGLYLLLNSDAVLRKGFFEALIAAQASHPKAGFFAPRIAYDDGTPQTSAFRFASPGSEIIRGANTGWVTKLLKRWEVALGPEPDPAAIEWASFACIAILGEMVDQLGPMDEGYFLYFEDAEYCLRARREGWSIVWIPQAVAVHYRGGSGPVKALARAKKQLPPYYYASRTRFLYQAYGRLGLWTANAAWYLGRFIAQFRRLFGKPVHPAAEREGCDIWINATTPLGPRRAPHE